MKKIEQPPFFWNIMTSEQGVWCEWMRWCPYIIPVRADQMRDIHWDFKEIE